MSSARLERLFRSTGGRLTAIYAVIVLVAFLGAGAGAWLATRSAADGQIRQRVAIEMAALQEEIRVEGLPATIAAIAARRESPGALEYRLTDAGGRLLAGDLEQLDAPIGWSAIDLPDEATHEEGREDLLVFAQSTPGGGTLLVAGDLAQAEHVRSAVLTQIMWIGALALLAIIAAGAMATRGALRQMDALGGALARVGAGDFAARLPAPTGGGDLAAMSSDVNSMLDRVGVLMGNLRRVSRDVAHELRTPLTHLQQQIEEGLQTNDLGGAHAALRDAGQTSERLLRLFSATLRLAEIESGGARARFQEVDLAALVERVGDAYGPDFESAGRTLHVGPVVSATIQGDDDLLAQALANLVENAARHAGEGAHVQMQVTRVADTIRLSVEDNGRGISIADRERLLEPFARAEESRGTPGAGLGLSIVAAVARLHNAELLLEDADPGLRVSLIWRRAH